MSMNRQQRISATINEHCDSRHLEVIDESHRHHVPEGAETHFKVIIVSKLFNEMLLINRHRTINEWLKDEFASGLHALSIHAFTPEQWEAKQSKIRPSPACRDGFDK